MLADRAALAEIPVPERNRSELEAFRGDKVRRVLLHPDDSTILSSTPLGRQAAARALELAQRVKRILEGAGMEVVMTRSANERLPLARAVETVANSNADALVIISVGESEFKDISGYRILYPEDTLEYEDPKAAAVREAADRVPLSQFYRTFQEESKVLATAMAAALRRLYNQEPNGLNPAPLFLARRAPMASVMVVAGYLSNPADAARLTNDQQQQKLAESIAEGVTLFSEHLGSGRPNGQ